MLVKQKESITFQELSSQYFLRIANCILSKGKSAVPPLFNGMVVLFLHLIKLFAKNLSKNSYLDDSGIS